MKACGRAVWLTIVILTATCARAEPQIAGYIEMIQGRVLLREAGSDVAIVLSPKTDVVRALHDGDLIRCDRGGSARLRLGFATRYLKPSVRWYLVKARWPIRRARDIQVALDAYGKAGGRARGTESKGFHVFSPALNAAVQADSLTLRWGGAGDDCRLSFAVRTLDRREIWSERNIRSRNAAFTSDQLRKALRSEQTAGVLRFELIVTGNCVDEYPQPFTILSAADEISLAHSLNAWKKTKPELLRRLGRGSVFLRFRLFDEAAVEYEQALALEPASRHLLECVIAAHERTGNAARHAALVKRLRGLK